MQMATNSTPVANRAMRRKVAQPLEALNHPQAHIRLATLLSIIGLGRSTWYRMMAEGTAPQPLRFGPRCSRWLASDVSKFLAERAVQGVQGVQGVQK